MQSNKFAKLNGKNLKIAIIQARFNRKITDNLAQGALSALKLAGVKKQNVAVYETPGSFEIPLVCQKLAESGKYHGIITIGAIIKGETAHFEYISQAAVGGVMSVMLETKLPITLGIITTYNLRQAEARCRPDQTNKGYEAGLALAEMILNFRHV